MAKKPIKIPVTESTSDEDGPLEPSKSRPSTVTSPISERELPKPMVIKSFGRGQTKTMPRKVWYMIGGAVGLILVAVLGWKFFGTTTKVADVTNSITPVDTTPTVTLIPRVLDGVPVQTDRALTSIYAVVIENQIDARPQSGLDKASVVYETLAEGGITRFLSLFPVGQSVNQIGPVRSARPYFISWAEEYKPLFVHAGGSPQALSYLKSGKANVFDFNQFSHGGNFIRDDARSAPHNLYTDPEKLYSGLRKGPSRDAVPNYSSWLFKGETPLDNRPSSVNDLVINFSSFSYKVSYTYDRVQNMYTRLQAEKPHLTRDGIQLAPKNVVVMFTKIGLIPNEKQRLDVTTLGSGKLLLFRDGTVTEGTWKKDTNVARLQFLDASGNPLALNPGQIWIETVATDAKVTY